jgi:hypothetical protein
VDLEEEPPVQETFMLQLLMRQAAEEAFVHVDSCNKVRKALLSKSVPMRGPYRVGNLLSFHRKSKWYGPAQMLGNQGTSSIWLLHGGVTLLVPETHAVQHLQRRSTRRTSWSYAPVANEDESWWRRMRTSTLRTTFPLRRTEMDDFEIHTPTEIAESIVPSPSILSDLSGQDGREPGDH